MNLFSKAYKAVHNVYKYEQTAAIDVGALQRIIITFSIIMLLIDMENLRQGEWLIGIATFVVAVICVLAALLLRRFAKLQVLFYCFSRFPFCFWEQTPDSLFCGIF